MKSRMLLFALVACLVAVTASAQSQTVSGTVVSSTSSQLVIDTPSGRRTFDVDANSNLPTGLAAGSRVDVEYHELAGGRLHAASVRMAPADTTGRTTGTGTTGMTGTTGTTGTPTTGPGMTGTTDRPAPTAPATGTTTGTRDTGTAAVDDDDDDTPPPAGRELPRTATPLPLLGLAGLAALAGGLALRRR